MVKIPPFFRPRVTAPVETQDLYNLFLVVSPTFTDLAFRALRGLPDCSVDENKSITNTREFYLEFIAVIVNLNAILVTQQDSIKESILRFLTEEGKPEVQENLVRILDDLENCFVSRKVAFERIGFQCSDEDKTYPKLRALRRTLSEDNPLREEFLEKVNHIIRIESRHSRKREELLGNLGQVHDFFTDLLPLSTSRSPCPTIFTNYPLVHVRNLTKTLFNTIKSNWCFCKAPDSTLHASRKTRLHLTKHQRFGTASFGGNVSPNSKVYFRVLFSTHHSDLNWQSTEVAVTHWEYVKELVKEHHKPIENGLCEIIQGVKKDLCPQMAIYGHRLCYLGRQSIRDTTFNQPPSPAQLLNRDFVSLKDLLRPDQKNQRSFLSSMEGQDRLILSFVLTTSLLHLLRGPWLQGSFCSDSICFLVSNQQQPDITNPYLTTNCSAPLRSERPDIDEPHPIPEILCLGILLLEIVRGGIIDIPHGTDRCTVALEHMDEWKWSRAGRFRPIYDHLYEAISACLKPSKLKDHGLHERKLNESKAREYIFEKVLWPLESALSDAYNFIPASLNSDIARAERPIGLRSFDQIDEEFTGYRGAAIPWHKKLNGVHALLDVCQKRCEGAQKTVEPVKIAVLDTGLQIPGERLQNNYEDVGCLEIKNSKDFVTSKGGSSPRGWEVDCDGHGSKVGEIILRVAPKAVLHVAKVFRQTKDLSNHTVSEQVHKQIAEAIECASDTWKVDIIVMSFGFEKPIKSISDAIETALGMKSPPLFFAATCNDGANNDMAWPANDSRVIGISSTDGYGVKSKFNPNEENTDFPILYAFGEGVPVSTADPLDKKHVSGASYATPVAAALVANLLGCIRMTMATSDHGEKRYIHIPERLRKSRGMVLVLEKHMKKKHSNGDQSLLPWDFLTVRKIDTILEDVDKTLELKLV